MTFKSKILESLLAYAPNTTLLSFGRLLTLCVSLSILCTRHYATTLVSLINSGDGRTLCLEGFATLWGGIHRIRIRYPFFLSLDKLILRGFSE